MTKTAMKFGTFVLLFLAGALALAIGCTPETEKSVTYGPPPETKIDDVVDTIQGVEIADPYRWLEDQESPETRAWIDEQNKYTDSIMQQLPGRQELKELMTKLIKIDSINAPTEKGGRYFYSKRSADQDLPIIYMREGLDGEEQVLLDPHPMSEDHTTSVDIAEISEDGKYLAYSVRKGGVDEVEIRILDVDTKSDLEDILPTARYFGISFTPDKSGMYYTQYGDEGPRVYYHALGTPLSEDKLIFGEGLGPDKIAYINLSDDGKWLLAHVQYGSSGPTEIHVKNVAANTPWTAAINDGKSHSYASFAGDRLLIQTDLNAPNGRLMLVDPAKPSVANWQEIVPELPDAVMENAAALGGKAIAFYLQDVKSMAKVYDMDGTWVRDITFDTIGSFSTASGSWDSNEAFIAFTSFHVPNTIYRYDIATGETTVWEKVEVPLNSESMALEQVWYTSRDGTKIPMFLLHKKDLKLNGENPTMLYGYGGFNVNITPYYNGSRAAWVEMGGVYAIANLRGGGEFGEKWHRAGMLESKQNVFDDFIAAAEWLIENKYTSTKHLGIIGGSNGGLLVGAAMTQRPDLFGAVVCVYPLLDMIRYQKFMVARFWVSEYGSSEDPEQFKYILAYSPYQNVEKGVDYPATLFISGDGDTRVAPLHARKMTAMVQKMNGGKNPILLRYFTKAGHSGGQPISQQIETNVDIYSFLRWRLAQ